MGFNQLHSYIETTNNQARRSYSVLADSFARPFFAVTNVTGTILNNLLN